MEEEPNIEDLKSKLTFGVKFWLEFEGESIMGSGWANLLRTIQENEDGSLTQASEECGYSYKYAWNILKRIETRTGMSPVSTGKGGSGGGGWVKLNEWGSYLIETYDLLEQELRQKEAEIRRTLKEYRKKSHD